METTTTTKIFGLEVKEAVEVISYADGYNPNIWEITPLDKATEQLFTEFEERQICYNCGESYAETGLNQGEYHSNIGPESGSEYIEATCPNCGAIILSETITYY